MSYGIAQQHVGINRCGEYLKRCRTKGPVNDPPLPPLIKGGRTAEGASRPVKVNDPWRRISGLVGVDADVGGRERKKKLGRLVRCLQDRAGADFLRLEAARAHSPAWTIASRWDRPVEEWREVECSGRALESYCSQLGIGPAKLSALTREYCGLSAGRILDGVKIRGLRRMLLGHFHVAAQAMWGTPGSFAERLCMSRGSGREGEEGDARDRAGRSRAAAVKRSRYFRTSAWEFFGLDAWEEEATRVKELLGRLEAQREENGFSLAALALRLGFDSAARLRRACLSVTGRTIEQIQRGFAKEIVEYYLAAEERELRRLAMREDEFGVRAREIYCGDGERFPVEPFCDRWSASEFGRAGWVEMMREGFG
jgi:hypothetical protein